MSNKPAYIVSALVVAIFSWYYFISRAFPVNVQYLNAVVAFSAVVIIGISFLLGPLAKFVKFTAKYEGQRKAFGIIGYALACAHVLLIVPLLLQSSPQLTLGDAASLAVAAVAFMIFTLMALTSTQKWAQSLGYDNWKSLQRTGYIAIVLVMVHVLLLQKGVFLTRITGQVAIGIVLLVLLLRGLCLVTGKPSTKITL
ncbi:MAG TPA: hypothetical protein HA254_03510 [Candidatus Diapherotrites archaeon]|uniref:Ferric oxidoreductase domain-containing protein n=1 Tax=Candidatus Iainarchaeum sp. TaxID=3101447 RepID=A0A7J4J3A3_9ARCH|nr:hypothetical protein [Candidatus Diapherotrites archaeon]